MHKQVWFVLPLLLAYLFVGGLYAYATPAWQAPDEPAHYNYIRQLAEGRLPVIEPADYDEAYRAEIVSAGFPPSYSVEPLTYEDWQPPLYYLLQTPVFLLFDGELLPLRLFSLLIGAGVVVAAFGVARTLWPERLWLALTAAAFVAFLPQHVAMLASINNDSLAELWIGLMLWLALTLPAGRATGGEEPVVQRKWFSLGVLLGLGFLTKATVYIMAPVLALALLWRYWKQWSTLLRMGLLLYGPAALLGALWWGRNLLVYGGFDVMGKEAHDAVVVGQLRTTDWLAQQGPVTAAGSFLQTSFQSFWGQFGWMGVVMDARIYQLLLLFSLLVLVGFVWAIVQPGGGYDQARRAAGPGSRAIALLAATFLLALALYLGYNITFVQHQGRYLFPALIPISVAVAVGLGAWVRQLLGRWPRLALAVPGALAIALVMLDLVALFRFILPQLT